MEVKPKSITVNSTVSHVRHICKMPFCNSCGYSIDNNNKFCKKCGAKNLNVEQEQIQHISISQNNEQTMAWSDDNKSIKITLDNKATQATEENADSFNEKGHEYSKKDEEEEAIKYYDKALAMEPNHWQALRNKGDSCFNLGQYDDAQDCYQRSLEVEPNDIDIIIKMLRIFDIEGKHKQARSWGKKALEYDSSNIDALFYMGFNFVGWGKAKEAISYFDKVLEIDPNHYDSLVNKSLVLYRKKKLEEALSYINRSTEIQQTAINLWIKSQILLKMKYEQEGQEFYNKACSISSETVKYLDQGGGFSGNAKSEY